MSQDSDVAARARVNARQQELATLLNERLARLADEHPQLYARLQRHVHGDANVTVAWQTCLMAFGEALKKAVGPDALDDVIGGSGQYDPLLQALRMAFTVGFLTALDVPQEQ